MSKTISYMFYHFLNGDILIGRDYGGQLTNVERTAVIC